METSTWKQLKEMKSGFTERSGDGLQRTTLPQKDWVPCLNSDFRETSWGNRPFPRRLFPVFQDEPLCETIRMENVFCLEVHFHRKCLVQGNMEIYPSLCLLCDHGTTKFSHKNLRRNSKIDQFRYIKIQPKTIDISTRPCESLWGLVQRAS